jgi:hypothetical protein
MEALVWLPLLAGSFIWGVVRYRRLHEMQAWRQVVGTVENHARRVERGRRSGTVEYADIGYSFAMDGEFYGGIYSEKPESAETVDDVFARFPLRQPVTVLYRPGEPQTNALVAAQENPWSGFLLFGVMLLLPLLLALADWLKR